uniref:hypothetical protein n=1 Tax=Cephaleuros karstenii TaxID=1985640 RepID=UPI001EDEF276|nr:hypothetical protein MFR52_pgp061 [Cephaleuros karstenii]UIB39098.1 hypothetical protein [Cephaleuros karstenii]
MIPPITNRNSRPNRSIFSSKNSVKMPVNIGLSKNGKKGIKKEIHKQGSTYSIVTSPSLTRQDSKFLICYFDFISFQGYAPINIFQFFSPGVGLIPFLEHDDGT